MNDGMHSATPSFVGVTTSASSAHALWLPKNLNTRTKPTGQPRGATIGQPRGVAPTGLHLCVILSVSEESLSTKLIGVIMSAAVTC